MLIDEDIGIGDSRVTDVVGRGDVGRGDADAVGAGIGGSGSTAGNAGFGSDDVTLLDSEAYSVDCGKSAKSSWV